MSEKERKGPLSAVFGIVAGILGGLWYLTTHLLDPAFILGGGGYGIVRMVTRYVGPVLVPGIPWSGISVMLSMAMLGVMLHRLNERKKTDT